MALAFNLLSPRGTISFGTRRMRFRIKCLIVIPNSIHCNAPNEAFSLLFRKVLAAWIPLPYRDSKVR